MWSLVKRVAAVVSAAVVLFTCSACSGLGTLLQETQKEEVVSASTTTSTTRRNVLIQTIHEGQLTVGINPGYKPYSYHENGELVGFDLDLIAEFGKSMGLETSISTMSFDQLFIALERGLVDCVMGMDYTPDRADVFYNSIYMTEIIDGDLMSMAMYTGNSNLASTFDSMLETYRQNGVYQQLVKRYFPDSQIL